MNRAISILLCVLTALALFSACGSKEPEAASEQVPETRDDLIGSPDRLLRPVYGSDEYGFISPSLLGYYTEFYEPSEEERSRNVLPVKTGKISAELLENRNRKTYRIEGTRYYVIKTSVPGALCFDDSNHIWSYDRRFFYQYAETEDGGKLYRNINTDSDEVLLFLPSPDMELLLFRSDSPLAERRKLSIDHFSSAVFGDLVFCGAESFEQLFKAHVFGTGGVAVNINEQLNCDYAGVDLECKRVPGLWYSFTLNWNDDWAVVYCRERWTWVRFEPDPALKAVIDRLG